MVQYFFYYLELKLTMFFYLYYVYELLRYYENHYNIIDTENKY